MEFLTSTNVCSWVVASKIGAQSRAAQCIDKEILKSKNGNIDIDIDIEIDKRMF